MRYFPYISLGFALTPLVLAAPAAELQLRNIFDRAVGDTCTAPEGKGSCKNTSNCKGISYPTGLCPKDGTEIQVSLISDHPMTPPCEVNIN
jgi:hypothetical protein